MGHSRLLRTVVAAGGAFQFLEIAGGNRTKSFLAVIVQKLSEGENLCFRDKQANFAVVAAFSAAEVGFQQRLADNIKIETERRMALFGVSRECGFRNNFTTNDLGCSRDVEVGLAIDDEGLERGSHPHIAQGSAQEVKRRVN